MPCGESLGSRFSLVAEAEVELHCQVCQEGVGVSPRPCGARLQAGWVEVAEGMTSRCLRSYQWEVEGGGALIGQEVL